MVAAAALKKNYMIKEYISYPLLRHNTFGIDVKAARFVEFSSEEELATLLENGVEAPLLVIGGGSNLLFAGDFAGTVLHSAIEGISVVEENDSDVLLRVGSGVNWDSLVEYTVKNGWQGLENLSAIPGEVGASAVQNVGAYGVEAGEFIHSVEALAVDGGDKRIFTQADCRFAYRRSIFKEEEKGKNAFEILERYTGKELEYREYEPLYECCARAAEKQHKKAHFVTCDDYVTMSDGTGIVHIAPAFGEDDGRIGKNYDLPFVQFVDLQGYMTEEPFKGMRAKPSEKELESGEGIISADPEVLKELKSRYT